MEKFVFINYAPVFCIYVCVLIVTICAPIGERPFMLLWKARGFVLVLARWLQGSACKIDLAARSTSQSQRKKGKHQTQRARHAVAATARASLATRITHTGPENSEMKYMATRINF